MTAAAFDLILLGAVLVVAVVAVVVPRRAGAAAAFLIFGIVLALLWARLDAPDIALAEAALGGGVAGALLVDALGSRRPPASAPVSWPLMLLGALAGAAGFMGLMGAVAAVPMEQSPLAREALGSLDSSGVEHPVTAVLLNYRSYDTLLEIAVLAVAALGAVTLARGPVRAPDPAPLAVRALAVVLLPIVLLLAAWLLVAGTSRPGGAFQSGALLGAALVIAHLSGVRVAGPRGGAGLAWAVAGLLGFIALAAGAAVFGDGWLVLGASWASIAILAVETALAVSIGVGLAMIFLANRTDDVAAGMPAVEEARA